MTEDQRKVANNCLQLMQTLGYDYDTVRHTQGPTIGFKVFLRDGTEKDHFFMSIQEILAFLEGVQEGIRRVRDSQGAVV